MSSVYRNRKAVSKYINTKVPRPAPGSGDFVRSDVGTPPGVHQGAQHPARRSRLGTIAKIVSTRSTGDITRPNNFCNGAESSRPKLPVQHKRRTSLTPEEQAAARVRRFALQSTAARLVPSSERVCRCLRRPVPVAGTVDVEYVPGTHSSHYRGLQVCSSVWACPICAALISEKRRDELAGLIKKHLVAGGSVYMTTYTIQHDRFDDLAVLLARFLAARRRMRQGRRGTALRKGYGVVGTVSVLEVTWSEENGWHPHVHELVFCSLAKMNTEGYEAAARSAWEDAAAAHGLTMNRHGFQLDRTYGAVADYVAKYGREPAIDNPWGVEAEMTKGHMKQGRGSDHFTPFSLLAAAHDGRADLAPKFAEYARCFKGRKQLTFSPGLKGLYDEQEMTDEELMAQHEHTAVKLVELLPEQWNMVLGNDIRGEVLEEARSGRPGQVLDYLAALGVELYPEQFTRFADWRVLSPAGPGRINTVSWCPVLKLWRCSVLLDDVATDGSRWKAVDLNTVIVLEAPQKEEDYNE